MNQKTKDIFVVGFALFAMFLGAGNLIFPPFLGHASGANWLPVLIGFVLTGVGLPLLGVYSTLKSGGSIMTLGRYVGKGFAAFVGVAIILAIGPFFAIPRTAATVHEVGVLPFAPHAPAIVTSILFFAATLFFSLNNSAVIDRIGKILTPFLILTLFAIVLAGIFNPLSTAQVVEGAPGFGKGFTEGYQTMDALASTMFAGVALSNVVSRGYHKREEQLEITFKCGIIAAVLLALVYGGLLHAGATSVGVFPADITRTALLTQMTHGLLGSVGQYCLSVAVVLACLTTSIGLTVTCGQYFNKLSKGKLSYTLIVLITTAVSLLISITGVSFIITLAVPVLYLMYPVLMVLVIFMALDKFIPNKNAYIGGVIGAFLISIITAANTMLGMIYPEYATSSVGHIAFLDKLTELCKHIPLHQYDLTWVLPALILAVIASLFPRKRDDKPVIDMEVFKEGTK